MKYIYIQADTNDCDYVTTLMQIGDEKLSELMPMINAIKDCKAYHNFPDSEFCDDTVENLYKDILTTEQIDLFRTVAPYGEHGVHTIVSIKLMDVSKEEQLL